MGWGRRFLLIEMAYLVFWLAYSLDWDGVLGVLVGIFFWLIWRTWCFGWRTLFIEMAYLLLWLVYLLFLFGIFIYWDGMACHVRSDPFRVLYIEKVRQLEKSTQQCWWRWWQITANILMLWNGYPSLSISMAGRKTNMQSKIELHSLQCSCYIVYGCKQSSYPI